MVGVAITNKGRDIMTKTYTISDGNATETADCWVDAVEIAEDWYSYKCDEDCINSHHRLIERIGSYSQIDEGDLDALNKAIDAHQDAMTEAEGHSAQAGYNLSVEIDEEA